MSVLTFKSSLTFELLGVCVTSRRSSEIPIIDNRSGLQSMQQRLSDNLSGGARAYGSIFDASSYCRRFSIRLDRPNDSSAQQLHSLLRGFGFTIAQSGPTHAFGSTVDAVASIRGIEADVIDASLSDHYAICWQHTGNVMSSASCADVANPALV